MVVSRKYLELYNGYIIENVDTSYIKKNLVNILFQLWFTPTLFLLFTQGTYYENNNGYKMIEYIRNYEVINLFLEYFYFNPFVFRSLMMFHHISTILGSHILVSLQNANIPIIHPLSYNANLLITTNLLLDMVRIFHKNNGIKLVFLIYYFILRIIIPFQIIVNISSGYYFSITPNEYIPVSLLLSFLTYFLYGLNIFWFYKLCCIARKYIYINK
jgi:hypothetical protein